MEIAKENVENQEKKFTVSQKEMVNLAQLFNLIITENDPIKRSYIIVEIDKFFQRISTQNTPQNTQ